MADIKTEINRYGYACESCHRHPLIIRIFTAHFNVGYEWEDSLSEEYCLPCLVKSWAIGKWYWVTRRVKYGVMGIQSAFTVKNTSLIGRIKLARLLYRIGTRRI